MKAAGDRVMLLLVEEDADKYFKSKSLRPGVAHATVRHLSHKPRIADMIKKADGYGFILKEDPKRSGECVPSAIVYQNEIRIYPFTHHLSQICYHAHIDFYLLLSAEGCVIAVHFFFLFFYQPMHVKVVVDLNI